MDAFMNKVQLTYGYSDTQIKIIRYTLTALIYDISKLIIFFSVFFFMDKSIHFVFAICPLILLRTKTGGLHLASYWSCFIATLVYLYSAIILLPATVPLHPLAIYPILLICAILCYLLGPNSLTRKIPSVKNYEKRAKLEAFQLVLIVGILIFLFSANEYLIISFWTIVLHTFQLAIAKIVKEVRKNALPH